MQQAILWHNYYDISLIERQDIFWDYFEFRRHDNYNRVFNIDYPNFDLNTHNTANQQQIANDNNQIKLKLLYYKFCEFENIKPDEEEMNWFWQIIIKECEFFLLKKRNPTIVLPKERIEKREKRKKLDPEIEEAIFITNEAIKTHNEIIEKVSYINTLKQNYYKKYWTLLEKTKAYLQLRYK